jgi:hypothetical protein
MKHRFYKGKAKGRTKYKFGEDLSKVVDTVGGADSLISMGSNLLTNNSINQLQTQTTAQTVPTKRREYNSFAGQVQRGVDRSYREGMLQMGNNANDGEIGKAKLLSSKFQAISDVNTQDAMAREQFEGVQDARQDRSRMFNSEMTAQNDAMNTDRYNRKIGARVGNNRAFAQEQLDINARSAQLTYDNQALLVTAMSSNDTKVISRFAKSFGYPETDEGIAQFSQDFIAGKLKIKQQTND